jgi:hypothetical protein
MLFVRKLQHWVEKGAWQHVIRCYLPESARGSAVRDSSIHYDVLKRLRRRRKVHNSDPRRWPTTCTNKSVMQCNTKR